MIFFHPFFQYATIGLDILLKRCEVNLVLKNYFDVVMDAQDVIRLNDSNVKAINYKGIAHMYLGGLYIHVNYSIII